MKDRGTNYSDDGLNLTEEEIELIRKRREKKQKELNKKGFDFSRKKEGDTDPSLNPQKIREEAERRRTTYQQNNYDRNSSYSNPAQNQNNSSNSKKAAGCGCFGTSVVALMLVICIVLIGGAGYLFSLLCKTDYKKAEESSISAYDLRSSKDVKNILLIGLDDDKGTGKSRSDTMMLLSLDAKNKAIKLTSFLRDLWVDIPGYNSAKLNAAYANGGPQLTIDTIENNFKIDIDNYILVDFNMFKQIIDSLGGIEIEITPEEAEFINRTTKSVVKAGLNELDGKKALIYARIRKLDSDFKRTERQRKVIMSILAKATKAGILDLLKLASNILPLIKTDINPFRMFGLLLSSIKYINLDIQQMQVPAKGAYKDKTIKGQAALVPDKEKNKDLIIKFIFE